MVMGFRVSIFLLQFVPLHLVGNPDNATVLALQLMDEVGCSASVIDNCHMLESVLHALLLPALDIASHLALYHEDSQKRQLLEGGDRKGANAESGKADIARKTLRSFIRDAL